jgi:hypothetical protein
LNGSGNLSSTQEFIQPNPNCPSGPIQYCSYTTWFNESTSYTRPGTYNVSVTIYDADSDWVIGEQTVEVDVPQFSVSITHNQGIWSFAGNVNNFSAAAYLPHGFLDHSVRYVWDMGDGDSVFGANISYSYSHRGDYYIMVTATDSNTGWGARAYTQLNVSDRPPHYVTAIGWPETPEWDGWPTHIPSSGTIYDPVLMNVTVTDPNAAEVPGLTVFWNFSDGSYATSGNMAGSDWLYRIFDDGRPYPGVYLQANMSHTWISAGWYHINVTVSDSEGLQATWGPCTIHITNPSPYLHNIPNVNVAVGQVALLNATAALQKNQGRNVTGDALANYTWSSSQYGPTYGSLGRYSSSYVSSGSASLTIRNQGASSTTGSVNVSFQDSPPIVGIDQIYSVVNISMWAPSFAPFAHLNITNSTGVPLLYGYGHSIQIQNFKQNILQNPEIIVHFAGPFNPFTGWLNLTYSPSNGSTMSVDTPVSFSTCCPPRFGCHPSYSEYLNVPAYNMPFYMRGVAFSPGTTSLNTTLVPEPNGLREKKYYCSPTAAGPTLCYFTYLETFPVGLVHPGEYLISTEDQHGKFGYDNITIYENSTAGFSVSDTAPQISLNMSGFRSTHVIASGTDLGIHLNDTFFGSRQTLNWTWGDEQYSNTTAGQWNGTMTSLAHFYYYSGRYVLALIATSNGGSATANWTYVTVQTPVPVANFTVPTTSPTTGESIRFDASNTTQGVNGAAQLSFSWRFGDSSGAGGLYGSVMETDHLYFKAKTYNVNLTVSNPEGQSSYLVKHVVVSSQRLSIQVWHKLSTTVNLWQQHTINVTSGPLSAYPLLNVTWQWASPGLAEPYGYGLTAGVAYPTLKQGGSHGYWWINVTAKTIFGGYAHQGTNWTSWLEPLLVLLPEQGDIVAGPSTNASLLALSLGTQYDHTYHPQRTYYWTFGNGSANKRDSSASTHDHGWYLYNQSGATPITVSAVVSGQANSTTQSAITLMPDSDGDGLPNAYKAINNIPLYIPMVGGTHMETQGFGPTNYIARYLNIWSLTDDGSGLTPIQEITGSVTGYSSNPLDPNQAGDGIPNGAHFFTDSFPANETNSFNSGVAGVTIPNVAYLGPAYAFNQSRLVVQLNESSNGVPVTGDVSLYLNASDGNNISLGAPQSTVATYYLLTANPSYGQSSSYDLSVNDFNTSGTWTLWAVPNSGVVGTIPSATIFVSYYTNPALADPTKQGLLEGHGLSTPVFNCSAPPSESYPVFNPNTLTVTNQSYWPYTETYFKLSLRQGVPYDPAVNSSLLGTSNTQTLCNQTSKSSWNGPQTTYGREAVANYLGDADFGISPYNAHAAGDLLLTNGMKALGEAVYNQTRGQYLNRSGVMSLVSSGYSGYPSDTIRYQGPLNPTARSTAGDGVLDSQAPDPVQPLGLNVTIYSANDPYCYIGAPTLGTPSDMLSISQSLTFDPNWYFPEPSGPTDYTSANGPNNSNGNGCDWVILENTGENNWNFTWGSGSTGLSYLLPLPQSYNSSTFTVYFQLWQNNVWTAQSARAFATVTGSVYSYPQPGKPGVVYRTGSGTGIQAEVKVQPMNRSNVVLVNTSSDVENLSGYGYRYTGEQRLYGFNLAMGSNLSNGADPWIFKPGLNTILESRSAFLNSTANSTGLSDIESLPCFGGATTTSSSSSNSSATGVQMTWASDLSSASCQTDAASLLADLLPLNATGKVIPVSAHEGWLVLNTTQVELLGLDPQTLALAPFVVPLSEQTPSGGPPNVIGNDLMNTVMSGVNALAGSFLAFGGFILAVGGYLREFGQWIVGVFENAPGAIAAAVNTAVAIIVSWVNALINFVKGLVSAIFQPVVELVNNLGSAVYAALFAANQTAAKNGQFVNVSETLAFWQAMANPLLVICLAITIALLVILTIVNGFSLGAGFVAGVVVSALITLLVLGAGSSDKLQSRGVPTPPLPADTSHLINNAANNTTASTPSTGSPSCSPCPSPISPSNEWVALGELFEQSADSTALVFVLQGDDSIYLQALFSSGWDAAATTPVFAATILTADGLFFTIVSVLLDAWDALYSEPLLEAASLGVGIDSVICDGSAYFIATHWELNMWAQIDWILFAADASSTAIAVAEYIYQNK